PVAVTVRVPVADHAQAGGLVDRAGGDRHRVAFGRIPEEARAAVPAETAARAPVALGTVDPAEGALVQDDDGVALRRRRGPCVAGPPAAFDAVADEDVAQLAPDLEADGAAQAATGCADRSSCHHGRVDEPFRFPL